MCITVHLDADVNDRSPFISVMHSSVSQFRMSGVSVMTEMDNQCLPSMLSIALIF